MIFRKPIDMTGVTILYRAENGTTKYRLDIGEYRRAFTIEHEYARERKLVGCSGISRFVTAFEARRGIFEEGERSWVWLTREDGWITRSHDKTLRKVLFSSTGRYSQRTSTARTRSSGTRCPNLSKGYKLTPCPLCLLGFSQPHTKADWDALKEPATKARLKELLKDRRRVGEEIQRREKYEYHSSRTT